MALANIAPMQEHGCPSNRIDIAIEGEVAKLPPTEAAVLRARYGLRCPSAAAESGEAPHEDAQRLHASALQRLRWRSLLPRESDSEWDEV